MNYLTSECFVQVFCRCYYRKNIKIFAFNVTLMKHWYVGNAPFFFRNNKQKCYQMWFSKRINISQKETKFIQFFWIPKYWSSIWKRKWLFVDIWYRVTTKTFLVKISIILAFFGSFWHFCTFYQNNSFPSKIKDNNFSSELTAKFLSKD